MADIKSITTMDGNKKGICNSATVMSKEPWFEDKLPGDGKPENSFPSLYNSTLSWEDESELSKNKSWFDMMEEDEADVSEVNPEEKQTMLDIKIKEEVIHEDEYNDDNLDHCNFHSETVIAQSVVPIVIKQEKDCDVTYAGIVRPTKQDHCATIVKQEKSSEKSICDATVSQHGLEEKNKLKVEKELKNSTLKRDLNPVSIAKVESNDQMCRKLKDDVTDEGLKIVQTECPVTVKQEKSSLASSRRSYADIVGKQGTSSRAIVIKQEISPEKTTQDNTCIENRLEKNAKAHTSHEHRHEEKTIKQGKKGSTPLKRERNSLNFQKVDSNYQGRKKIKQEASVEDSANIQSTKFIKQPQDDDSKEGIKDKEYSTGKCLKSETDDGISSNKNRKRTLDSSSESINLKRERTGSSSSNSTNSLHQKREYERDPEVLARRQKQIDYGKNTIGYDNYRQQIPKETRTSRHPRTPPKHVKYSRRGWDGMVRIWRQQLHVWDPASETGEEGLNDSASEFSMGAGSFTSDDISDSLPTEHTKSESMDDIHNYDDYLELD